jgi:predicted HicB family RNase H-like nuclease
MNLMNVDGYHAKIDYDEETDQFRGEILGLSGGADFMGPVLRSFGENSKSHWTFFLRSARSRELSPVDTIQASSIFGFHLNYMRSWR